MQADAYMYAEAVVNCEVTLSLVHTAHELTERQIQSILGYVCPLETLALDRLSLKTDRSRPVSD